jgi:two-component system cell cycle response regulator
MPSLPTESATLQRVLIVDDSKIVRAMLSRHLIDKYLAREAIDGLEAWEALLIDPAIRVVITDLSMPNLDGYGLLQRIRGSKIARIRNLPVVIISGAQEQDELRRARAAGATDLITKGVSTVELLSRLALLTQLERTQYAFEQALEAQVKHHYGSNRIVLSSPSQLVKQVQNTAEKASRKQSNFVLLTIRVGLQHLKLAAYSAPPPESVLDSIGQLIAWKIRQSDSVALTGLAEFTLTSANVPPNGVLGFARRICKAISSVYLQSDPNLIFVASGGLVGIGDLPSEPGSDVIDMTASLLAMAARRAGDGFDRAHSGVTYMD